MTRIGTIVNPEYKVDMRNIKVVDYGNIKEGLKLENAHEELTKTVLSAFNDGTFPFVVGGSNDQSYPNFQALSKYYK